MSEVSRKFPTSDEVPVVLITGAATGLGLALAGAFAEEGWYVEAAGHSSLPPVTHDHVQVMRLDVTDKVSINEAVGAVLGRRGRLDVLVNNAGVASDAPLARMEDQDWDRVLDVNLKGPFLCSQAVLRPMLRQRSGHILNIGSFSARGARGQANYSAAKAGLVGLTLSLAKEVGGRGIRVNAVLPGVLPTRMTASLADDVKTAFAAANALGRISSLEGTARAIVRIAAFPDCSGQVFQLDSRVGRWA